MLTLRVRASDFSPMLFIAKWSANTLKVMCNTVLTLIPARAVTTRTGNAPRNFYWFIVQRRTMSDAGAGQELSICDEMQLDETFLDAQNMYLFGVLVAVVALAVAVDTLRSMPNKVLRTLLAVAALLNLVMAVLNLVAFMYPFNCQWEAYRAFDYVWTPLSCAQTFLLPFFSMYRALSAYDKLLPWYIGVIAVVAVIPCIMNLFLEVAYLAQIVDDETAIHATYNAPLQLARFVLSYVLETTALLSIVGKVLWAARRQPVADKGAVRGAWLVLSVVCRVLCVIVFYTLGCLRGSRTFTMCYACSDSILLIMVSIDEVRFKSFLKDARRSVITSSNAPPNASTGKLSKRT